MKKVIWLIFFLPNIVFAGDPYKKVYKQEQKIEKLESKRKYVKALDKSFEQLSNPFSTIKKEDKIRTYLNHAELLALLYKNSLEFTQFLDSAISVSHSISSQSEQETLLEASKINLLALNYIGAQNLLDQILLDDLEDKSTYYQIYSTVLSKQGFYNSAIETLKKGESSEFNYLFRLQRLYAEYGDHKTAKNLLAQITQLSQLSQSSRELGLTNYTKALNYDEVDQLLLCNAELEEAIKTLEKSKALKPRNILVPLDDVYDYATLSNWQIQAKDKKKVTKSYLGYITKTFGSQSVYQKTGALTEAKAALIGYNYNDAIQIIEESEEEINELLNPTISRDMYSLLALALTSREQFEDLDTVYHKMLSFTPQVFKNESPNFHKDYLDYSIFLNEYRNKPLEALSDFEEGYETYISPEWNLSQNENQYYLDKYEDLLLEIGNNKKAETLARKSLSSIEKQFGNKSLFYGNKLERIAEIQIKQTHIKSALETIEEAYNIYNQNNIIGYDLAHLDKTLCKAWTVQGDFTNSLRLLKKAQKTMSESSQDYNEEEDLSTFAAIYIHQGKYNRVQTSLYKKLEHTEKTYGTSDKRNIEVLNELGNYHLLSGDFALAEKHGQRAVELSDSIYGKLPIYAESLKLLADINMAKGDHDVAEKQYEESLSIFEQYFGESHLSIALITENLALLAFNYTADTIKTENLLVNSLKVAEENIGSLSPIFSKFLTQLCHFYLEIGDLNKADKNISLLAKTLKSNDVRRKSDVQNIELLILQGELLYAKEEYKDASSYFNKASRQTKELFSSKHPTYRSTLSRLAESEYSEGDIQKAIKTARELTSIHLEFIESFFNSLSEREKTKYWKVVKNDFEFFNAIAFEYASTDPTVLEDVYNITLSTKALLLNNSIKVRENILNSGDDELISLFNKLIAMKEELLAINSMTQEDINQLETPIEKFRKEILQLEKKINEKAGNYSTSNDVSWKDVKSNLKKEEYALEIVRFRKFNKHFTDSVIYAGLILDKEKKSGIHHVLFSNGNELESRLFSFYKNTRILFLNDSLSYTGFWKPFEKYIPRNSTVYYSPDGIYSLMNPETFKIDNSTYVIDYFDIHTLTNTKELVSKQHDETTENKTLSIVANPNFYPENYTNYKGVSKLPGTDTESNTIVSIANDAFETVVLKEREALEHNVKQIDNPTILHFATHGYFKPIKTERKNSALNIIQDNSLLKSGLILTEGGQLLDNHLPEDYNLSDGLLTSYEVLNMKLDKTDLVILSACETGLGTGDIGEGVYGLQKAFLVAGANNVIMSIFKVSDIVAVEFMKTYYELLLEYNDKRKALLETKKRVRLAHPEPFYWGSFVMVGK